VAAGGDGGIGGPSLCSAHTYAVCEDFESTAIGGTPAGWTIPTSNYGTATAGVANDFAARGSNSWKVTVNAAGSTEHYLQRGNLGALANAHYGRIFLRIQGPTVTTFIHWDVILGAGNLMNGGAARRIRWGNTGSNGGLTNSGWHWIYNIEQGDRGTEDNGAGHPVPGVDEWMCVEWMWDRDPAVGRFLVSKRRATGAPLHDDAPRRRHARHPGVCDDEFRDRRVPGNQQHAARVLDR
jgi:hypothetical protein